MSDKRQDPGAIVKDPELVAMSRVAKALGDLTEAQRDRVLTWVIGRYVPGRFRLAVAGEPVEDGKE